MNFSERDLKILIDLIDYLRSRAIDVEHLERLEAIGCYATSLLKDPFKY